MRWHLQACAVLAALVTTDRESTICSVVQVWEWEPSDTQHQLKLRKACTKFGHCMPGAGNVMELQDADSGQALSAPVLCSEMVVRKGLTARGPR